MSIRVFLNKNLLLHLKNTLFDALYKNIIEIIESENIILEPSMQKLLNDLDQETYGYGCVYADVAEHLKTRDEFSLLANLIKKALDKEQSSDYKFSKEVEDHILKAHEQLLIYGKYLPL